MKKEVMVVGGVFVKDNKYFICRRSEGDIEAIGKWEFPGGTVETGETNQEALKREMMEEFKVNIIVKDFIKNIKLEYQERIINISFYYCDTNDFFDMQDDHLEYKWVSLEELNNYDFAPVDKELVLYMQSNQKEV